LQDQLTQLGIENPTPLTHIFISIIDGMIIDGTTDKKLINAEKIWQYIEFLINEEIPQQVS
ncbi:TetR/AcrR family transcriptional regulator, partial [Acinetobacter oleivorans]|nr:TetR/AcrR family transcriptional regulator [Acinetobacter oleivorans]